jgi:hypothetical protein
MDVDGLKKIGMTTKPVGDGDHEVLGMGSFREYTTIRELSRPTTAVTRAKH